MSTYTTSTSDKKRTVALLLCLFLGLVGAHRFYVGRVGSAILFTCCCFGFFGIVPAIDFVMILLGSFRDNVGAPLREW